MQKYVYFFIFSKIKCQKLFDCNVTYHISQIYIKKKIASFNTLVLFLDANFY